MYQVINEVGEVVEEFRLKITAQQNLPGLKFNKREKLEIVWKSDIKIK